METVRTLWSTLEADAGRFGLVVGPHGPTALARIGEILGLSITSVSSSLLVGEHWRDPSTHLRGHKLLGDLEILFDPHLGVDPLLLLSQLARANPIIASWPGIVTDSPEAVYSVPGRSDHYRAKVPPSALILTAVATSFPDESPFVVERTQ